jgi:hypothetical protein
MNPLWFLICLALAGTLLPIISVSVLVIAGVGALLGLACLPALRRELKNQQRSGNHLPRNQLLEGRKS